MPPRYAQSESGTLAMAPLLAKYLRAWQMETAYARLTDWVFASDKTRGRTPRVGNMLCMDYLRPAAINAGVKLEKGQRFGFHNLRHSLASFLVTKKKTDIKTAQRSMRHAGSAIMLDHYAQTECTDRHGGTDCGTGDDAERHLQPRRRARAIRMGG